MKVLLQDGKTVIENVARVEERVAVGAEKTTLTISVPTDSITTDKITEYAASIGFDKLTVVSENDTIESEYSNATLKSIIKAFTDADKYIRIVFNL